MRRALVSLVLAVLAAALTTQLAVAAKPTHEKFTVDETFTEELCGISVTTHLQIKGNVLFVDDREVDLSQALITWSNSEGDWLELFFAGPDFIETQLHGDIRTVDVRIAGVPERMRSSEGLTPVFDRGLVVYQDTVDLNDLDDPDDNVLLGREVFFQAGPHPDLDSDLALFCEVVLDVLG
jgi:hypothetical protein